MTQPHNPRPLGERSIRRRFRSILTVALLAASVVPATAVLTASQGARAELPPAREMRLAAPGRSLAGNDQSSSIAQNPANLGFLTNTEARWTWVHTGEGSPDPNRGHAFDFAFPLPFSLASGFRLDFMRPTDSAPAPFAEPYTWFTWALALRSSEGFALGFSLDHAYSDDRSLDGLTTFSFGATARPSPYFGLAVVGRDLNAPTTNFGAHLDRSVDIGVAVRPTGRRNIEIGLEDHYVDDRAQWYPRGTVGVDVPYVGRVRGDVILTDPTATGKLHYAATAGLELGWGTASAEGGAVFGSSLGGRPGAGFYTGLSLSTARVPGLPEPAYALKIRIEDTPGPRAHTRLLRQLWDLARDPELKAVALVLKAEPADSLAHAEELGDAIRLLRANGKKVVCHLEDAGGRSLYVCSQADRIAINPAGGIRFAGLKTQHQYFAGLLDKIGVHAEFIRIGAHKTAPEEFTRTGPSDTAREDYLDMLHEYESVFLSDIGGGRHIGMDRLKKTFANGPFVAAEAKQAGLVDTLAFDDEVGAVVDEAVGARVPLIDEPRAPDLPARFGAQRKVALVYVDGDMVDGRSKEIPLLGTKLAGSYTIAKTMKDVREDPLVGAVVLRVESPGGSSMAADVMWREIALTAKRKPVVVSMGSYAASGGYYISAPGNIIFANPLTVTGSIGIFYGKADVAELIKKIGVNVDTFKTAPRADAESIYRPFTKEEIEVLSQKVRQFYEVFLDRVATGRHMTKEAVDAVGQGRVWSGREAAARGLVDRLGGLRDALEQARRMSHLPSDAPIEELPVPETSLLGLIAKVAGADQPEVMAPLAILPPQIKEVARQLVPFAVFGPYEPLARMELFTSDPP